MDIARPSNAKKKRIKQAIYAGVGLLAVVLVSVGLSRLKPAAPTVERAVVWPDTVKRGSIVIQVRGLGTLTPEDIRAAFKKHIDAKKLVIIRAGDFKK